MTNAAKQERVHAEVDHCVVAAEPMLIIAHEAAILAIVWLDLRDADDPSAWNRAGIGVAFAVLLTTRYEAFLIAFILFALDELARQRLRFILWSVPAAVAGAPDRRAPALV